jgi:drug/metabolite transporter (DMT)-like permease
VHRASTGRVVLLALILGFNFLWIKLAIRGVSPVEVTLSRLVLGSAVLFVVVIAKRGAVPRSVMIWPHIAVAAIFANAVPFLLFAEGEQHVSSSTAGMLNATTPLWTVVIALATRHQQATSLRQVGGLAVGFIGTMLIFQPWCSATRWLGTSASRWVGMTGDGKGPADGVGGAWWCPGCRGGARVVVVSRSRG